MRERERESERERDGSEETQEGLNQVVSCINREGTQQASKRKGER